MSEKQSKTIPPNTECQIIKESTTFFNKYGNATPKIIIEDLAQVVFDNEEWWEHYNNPAIASFILRSILEGINPDKHPKDIKFYYGKIQPQGLGEIVWEEELKVISKNEGK